MIEYLDLADYLLIAEAVTGIAAEVLAKLPVIDLADSALHAPQAEYAGTEFYPDFATKAAVLCARLLRNHPLPDGNKRSAWVSLQEFMLRNGYDWQATGVDEAEQIVVSVASGELNEEDFATWIATRLTRD